MNNLRPVKYKEHCQDKNYKKGFFHKFSTLTYFIYSSETYKMEERIGEFAIIETERGNIVHIHSTNITFLDRK